MMPELPCETSFEVVDESDDWIVVSKPAPLIVHPTDKKGQPTLLCGVEQLLSYDLQCGARLSIINRLDRETSGLVLIAKNKTWARAFSRAMERREVKKSYYAIASGVPSWQTFELDAPIGNQRDVMESAIWVKQMVHDSGKQCRTDFEVVESRSGFSLLKVKPHTGRMHQIRVHAAYLGLPLVGDKMYGGDEKYYLEHMERGWTTEMEENLLLPRQALHAEGLEMEVNGEWMSWSCPLASDLQTFWDSQMKDNA